MTARPYIPLFAKVLGWLFLHLLLLAVIFASFVAWQLGLGMDSLLSGSAGERLRDFGETARSHLIGTSRDQWNEALKPLAQRKKVTAAIFDPTEPTSYPAVIPANVLDRLKKMPPPRQAANARRGPPPGSDGADERRGPPPGSDDMPPPDDGPDVFVRPPRPAFFPEGQPTATPLFLMRGEKGNGYWAAVQLRIPPQNEVFRGQFPPPVLLIRAERLDGSGMFFDFKPWLWGGLAVLVLSIAFWTPFVLGITRYLKRLKLATEGISSGHFHVELPTRGQDELSSLGHSLEAMAQRLDHLISGQKRFLGDAAHELCAPLVRIRTGLSIMEMKLAEESLPQLESIAVDATELAALVEEILAFSRAGTRPPRLQTVNLLDMVNQTIFREGQSLDLQVQVPEDMEVSADSALLSRAIGNLLRNATVHAGSSAKVSLIATEGENHCLLAVTDNGPGVSETELPRLFEPFYRPDLSRSRDTGGSGLGLAIVQTAIHACNGEVSAHLPASGGFSVTIRLQKP